MSVGQLLDENLHIPAYQRPYSWLPATATRLLDDILDSMDDDTRRGVPYVLGAVILHQQDDRFEVVDGQQRLLTLRMLTMLLTREDAPFLTDMDNPVARVWAALDRRLGTLDETGSTSLLDHIHTRCQVVRIVTDDIDEAFRVFDSQNYRGKPLNPHDLLKAHHLRAMDGETLAAKTAVVQGWESVSDEDLDRLFSVYLYRIARWSRGERALGFTTHDIAIFKGIPSAQASTPSARYHLAAQAAIPILSAWGSDSTAGSQAAVDRTRFQLDAPVPTGRGFFEMVDFMLAELARVVRVAFPDELERFGLYDLEALAEQDSLQEHGGRSRYRYVTELYVAALLYYTNRFGVEKSDFAAARDQLFTWAYRVRVELLRVQFRSVDNYARSGDEHPPAFTLLRNSTSGRVIRELSVSPERRNDTHEAALFRLLAKTQP